ncbi:MAG: hypothetical protein ACW964_11405 [Candidatus Hodarchaeales archaeon]|jgi:hypothetical protein
MENDNIQNDFNASNQQKMEELANYINQANGIQKVDEPVASDDIVEESEQTLKEEETIKNDEETIQNDEEVKPQKNQFFDGKSNDELINIIENGTKKISQQENNINMLKKQVEELTQLTQQFNRVKEDEELENKYSNYEPSDLEAIKSLAREEFQRLKSKETEQTQQELENNFRENDSDYRLIEDNLMDLNPELIAPFQNELSKRIDQFGKNSTIHKKGWIKSIKKEIISQIRKTSSSQNQIQKKNNVIARKVKANSPQANSTANNSNSWKNKPQPTNPEEYRIWLKENQGISI